MANDLKKLALKLAAEGPHKTLPTPRLIQVLFNGVYLMKTTNAVFVWEHPYYPQLYLPRAEFTDVPADQFDENTKASWRITPGEEFANDAGEVVARQLVLQVGGRKTERVVAFEEGKAKAPLGGLVKVEFGAVDQWFEEATPMFVHPKDPFKRIDILPSTREVVVRVGGVKVAETKSSMHLYETGLPARFYLPQTCVDPAVLRKSAKGTKTRCPYKGEADYFDVVLPDGQVFEDVIWYYEKPLLESASIVGLCCFYNEKVQIELDGKVLEPPVTHFNNAKPNQKPSIV